MIELWHEWNSVQSFKVRIVLAEKQLDWTARRVDLLKFEHLRPEYLRLNPNGVVPTLVHDGHGCSNHRWSANTWTRRPRARPHARESLSARSGTHVVEGFRRGRASSDPTSEFQLLYRPLLELMPPAEFEARVAGHPNRHARSVSGMRRAALSTSRQSSKQCWSFAV